MPGTRLDSAELRSLLDRRASDGRSPSSWDVAVIPSTGSTNADLAELADGGAPHGTVLVTDDQRAGRGRLARTWVSPAGSGLAISVLVRPDAPRERWTWLPLVAGVAVAEAVDELGVTARLKWPNDVLVDGRKLAGILVEVVDHGRAAVIGIGLNITAVPDIAASSAVSLRDVLPVDPYAPDVLARVLHRLDDAYATWCTDDGAIVLSASYLEHSGTVGRAVSLTLPGGGIATGVARGIDPHGALVVDTADGRRTYAAGDIEHLR